MSKLPISKPKAPYERLANAAAKISDKGVLHVDVERLFNAAPVKRQLEAVRRLQHAAVPARRKSGR